MEGGRGRKVETWGGGGGRDRSAQAKKLHQKLTAQSGKGWALEKARLASTRHGTERRGAPSPTRRETQIQKYQHSRVSHKPHLERVGQQARLKHDQRGGRILSAEDAPVVARLVRRRVEQLRVGSCCTQSFPVRRERGGGGQRCRLSLLVPGK